MTLGHDGVRKLSRPDLLGAALVFLAMLAVFWWSPVTQVTDSHYSLLLSESLLQYQSFALDHYSIPRLEPQAGVRDDYVANGSIWQLELVRNHIYYYFPPGTSILSLPGVAVANWFHLSVVNPDGSYNARAEIRLQKALAAILMAIFVALVYLTSRVLLPAFWSLIVALCAALGTQVWSTTSRGLWSHTWEVLLAGVIVFLLVKREFLRRRLNPFVLGSLVAWAYFVRPSAVVLVVGTTLYVLISEPKIIFRYLLTGSFWLALFALYSWKNFGQLVPNYYKASRLRFDLLPAALAGNLISPSRGLFVYVPILLFVGYLLARYRKYLASPTLVVLSLFVIFAHLLVVSSFANRLGDWWGGASYGARYTADLVPWFSLLAIVGLNAMLKWREQHEYVSRQPLALQLGVATVLVGLSIFINARGAWAQEAWKWSQPNSDQQMRALLWDWRHPQFLAGLQEPAPLILVPRLEINSRLNFASPNVDKFLWYGWSEPESEFRWTDGQTSAMVFVLDAPQNMTLQIKAGPFVAQRLQRQDLRIALNGNALETLTFEGDAAREFSVNLPKQFLSQSNVLKFSLPNATSPTSLGIGEDSRKLGMRIEWMHFQPAE